MLLNFPGTLILVSHDRALLDNLVTSTLILTGDGQVTELVGGYTDWRKSQSQIKPGRQYVPQTEKTASRRQKSQEIEAQKLSYREQRELEQLPGRIEGLEAEQAMLNERMNNPAFYQGDYAKVSQAVERLKTLEAEIAQVYQRWVELDG
jgi:ATP-binding cassette subfamily F protein uup